MGNPVVHWELISKEPAKVADFYAKIFGWKVNHVPGINYRIVDTGAKEGIKRRHRQARPLVDDLAEYRKIIVAAGGKIHVEEQEVPRMGKFSLFTDPEGGMMGLWKAKR
jgi:uncharacterized protein